MSASDRTTAASRPPNQSFLYGPNSTTALRGYAGSGLPPTSTPGATPVLPAPSPRARRLGDAPATTAAGGGGGTNFVSPVTAAGGGLSSSFRLASLDRLAIRQRLYEQQNGVAVDPASAAGLQSKRELFFKNEPPGPGAGSTPTANSNSTGSGPGVGMASGGNPVSTAGSQPTPTVATAALSHTAGVSSVHGVPSKDVLNRTASTAPPIKDPLPEDNRERERFKDREREKDKDRERRKEVDGYVGFANLPNQVYRKAVKRGFDFTLMVVGESGLGKSTLINSMFLADIYSAEYPGPSRRVKKTVQVETCKVLLKENGVNLNLTVVDTPGFGDAVDNSNCWQPVIDYIESKYEEHLNAESRVRRTQQPDSRVHCCLYFVSPGHGLKPLDVEFMRRLHDKVNIIPIVAKADTMMPDECAHFKKQVLNEIAQHKIKIYEFPDCDDPEENKSYKQMKERVPFAVVGSNAILEVDGRKVRGRRYPWGIVEVENTEHCDFIPLRNLLVRTHMQDLRDVTNNVHYENYRCRKLAGLGEGKSRPSNKNPLAQMEEEKREHETKMKKMETEMEQVFEMKVKEKRQKLKDSEFDLQRRHEQMKKALEQQQREMEEKRRAFEAEKGSWETTSGVTIEDLRRRSLEANSKEQVDGKTKDKKKKGLF